jgi:hypothetical protein
MPTGTIAPWATSHAVRPGVRPPLARVAVRPARTCERCGAAVTSRNRQARLCRVCMARHSLAVQHERSTYRPAGHLSGARRGTKPALPLGSAR